MIKQLFLNLSLPGWVFLIFVLILVTVAVFYYRRTLPPLLPWRRGFLTVLRSAILAIVIFLLLQPVLQVVYQFHEPPVIGMLLDDSGSMKIKDSYGERADSVEYILRNADFSRNSDSLRFERFTFRSGLRHLQQDTMTFSGKQTNISNALQGISDSLAQTNLRAIVLVSDGQFNQGVNPVNIAGSSSVPVYTVTVGDTVPRKDLRISGLQATRVSYVGEEIPVSVQVMQKGFDSGKITVRLWNGKKQVEAKTVDMPPGGFEQQVNFSVKADQPGEFRYTVELVPQKGEVTSHNNESSFLLKVLKSKMRVLLISGQPTFDERMLIYVLRQLPDVQLSVLTEEAAGQYYEGNFQNVKPDSQDALIFLGFPTRLTSAAHLQQIFLNAKKSNIPLYLMLNSGTDLHKLAAWNELLPIDVRSRVIPQENVAVHLTTGGRLHPVTRLEEDPQRTEAAWQNLPPVTGLGRYLKIVKGSSVLLDADNSAPSGMPLLIAGVRKDEKTLVLAATDVSAWHLQLQDDPTRDTFFQRFIERSLKWLVNREDIRRIQIHPRQKVFSMGENIEFSGQVLDDFYQPVNDAQVEIKLASDSLQRSDMLAGRDGFYSYQASGLPPGTYTYKLTARRGDQVIGDAEGKFVVQQLELELQQTEANSSLMREIALRSGGKNWGAAEFVKHLPDFRFKKQVQLANVEHILWDKIYWLIVLVLVLTVEWFFRKRWGLL